MAEPRRGARQSRRPFTIHHSPLTKLHLRRCPNRVDRQIRAAALLLVREADAYRALDDSVDDSAGGEGVSGDDDGAAELDERRNATHAAQRFEPEDAASDAAPETTKAMQRPDAEHVV